MPHHYAVGIRVGNPPDWLKSAAPGIEWFYLERGVCDLCETEVRPVWQTTRYGYTYCRQCIEHTSVHRPEYGII